MITFPLPDPLQGALADIRSLPTPYLVHSEEEQMITRLFLGAVVGNLKADIFRGEAQEVVFAYKEMEGALRSVNDYNIHGSHFIEELIISLPPPQPLPTYKLTHLRDPDFVGVGPFHLDATDSDLSNQELESLVQRYPNIESLTLNQCHLITDAGLAHLNRLTNLQSLNLSYCQQISDAVLAHLRGLTNLQSLDLRACNLITDAGLEDLRQRLPDCNISN